MASERRCEKCHGDGGFTGQSDNMDVTECLDCHGTGRVPCLTSKPPEWAVRAARMVAACPDDEPACAACCRIIERESPVAELCEALAACVKAFGRINLGLLRSDVATDVYGAQLQAEAALRKARE